MKEKYLQLNDEKQEAIQTEVKRVISLVYQRLKAKISSDQQLNGEQFLSRALNIIKKSTLQILSDEDQDQAQSSEEDGPPIITQAQEIKDEQAVSLSSIDSTVNPVQSDVPVVIVDADRDLVIVDGSTIEASSTVTQGNQLFVSRFLLIIIFCLFQKHRSRLLMLRLMKCPYPTSKTMINQKLMSKVIH